MRTTRNSFKYLNGLALLLASMVTPARADLPPALSFWCDSIGGYRNICELEAINFGTSPYIIQWYRMENCCKEYYDSRYDGHYSLDERCNRNTYTRYRVVVTDSTGVSVSHQETVNCVRSAP